MVEVVGRKLDAIAIVEDSAALRETLVRALSHRAARTIGCATVAKFLELLESTRPDLIVLDVELPDGSAFDVLRACSRSSPKPVVVAMSGVARPDDTFRLGQLGVRRYIAKPLDLSKLDAAIDEALGEAPDVLPMIRESVGHLPMREVEESIRLTMLEEALARSGGNRRGAARLLSISRQHLQHLMRKARDGTLA